MHIGIPIIGITFNSSSFIMSSCDLYMPAEWHPHAACIILYPTESSSYPRLAAAQAQVLGVVRAIATVGAERVLLLCPDTATMEQVRQQLENANRNVILRVCARNDTWARDTAPTFVIAKDPEQKQTIVGLDWNFNAYGGPELGCYWPCHLDQQIAAVVCDELLALDSVTTALDEVFGATVKCTRTSVPLVLEGGSIHTDGRGTLLTTEECLLNPNRNPTKTRDEIAALVLTATGCTEIIWLPDGLDGDDDTNGHIDNWACFVRPGHVVLAWTDDEELDKENYRRCRLALDLLEKQHQLTVHKLYVPSPPLHYTKDDFTLEGGNHSRDENSESAVERQLGQRLAASYINFYIANAAIVVPQFGSAEYDRRAIATLTPLFPDHVVVGVPTREILLGGGNIHCITQQIPAAGIP
jgi:agmatine deiminase